MKMEKVRACFRHTKYIEECPHCNQEAIAETHANGKVAIVYRKRVKREGKY